MVPFVLKYGYGVADMALPVIALYIFIGEIAGAYVLGEILGTVMLHRKSEII